MTRPTSLERARCTRPTEQRARRIFVFARASLSPITRGTTIPASTVPTQVTLIGCDGTPLTPGAYRLRALVGYALDGAGTGKGGYVIASESVDLTIT